jgi:hypothetical protein
MEILRSYHRRHLRFTYFNVIVIHNFFLICSKGRGAGGGAVGWGTSLQAGRWRVPFPIVSLEFFIDVILPTALWSWDFLRLYLKWVPRILIGVGGDWCVELATLPPSCAECQSGCLNLLEPPGLSRLVQGLLLCSEGPDVKKTCRLPTPSIVEFIHITCGMFLHHFTIRTVLPLVQRFEWRLDREHVFGSTSLCLTYYLNNVRLVAQTAYHFSGCSRPP